MVEAAVLVRALERDDVDRLLDDADRRVVSACVEADRTRLLLGQVAALAAEAHPLLDLGERGSERERFLGRALEDVEGEPLRGPLSDSGQAGELRDEVLDGGRKHAWTLCPRNQTWPFYVHLDMTSLRLTASLVLLALLPLALTACGGGGGGY